MASAFEIREHLAKLLSAQLSLDDFEDWFVPYSWNIHKHGDEVSQEFAYAIEHELSRSDEDCPELRQKLAQLLGSFAVSCGSNEFGDPIPPSVAESNATSDFIRVAA